MNAAVCFKCGNKYGSNDQDDLAGDGKCPPCKELSKRVALKVDLEIAERRRNNPLPKNPRSEIIHDLLQNGGRINIRDLGITPHD